MKNVVLISPPEKHLLMEAGDRPYMGLLYVAAELRRSGHRPIISDLNHDSYVDLNKKMNIADCAGIITFTPYFEWTKNFAKHLKQNFPDVKLVAGGPHATVQPDSLSPYFDHIVMGEGEKAMVAIVNGLEEKIIRHDYENDLDQLPFPLSELNYTNYGLNQEGFRTITLLSSRSCNYHCGFCTKDILGKKQRFHGIDRVVSEIEQAKRMGFNSVYFLDDHFTSDKKRALGLIKRIKPLNITYRISTRTDKVDDEILGELKKSGCRSIGYGLEHMDNDVLKKLGKNNSVENHLRAIELTHKHGIRIRGTFIVNLPGATKTTNLRTLELAKQNGLEFADFYTLIAYPGTPIWDHPEKFGIKVDKGYGFNQTSFISNVENGTIDNQELESLIGHLRSEWSKFKGLDCPWEQRFQSEEN